MSFVDDDMVFQWFIDFLDRSETYGEKLKAASKAGDKSFVVPFTKLHEKYRKELLRRPERAIRVAESAIARWIIDNVKETETSSHALNFRPKSLPIDKGRMPGSLETDDIAQLRAVHAIVSKVVEIKPRLLVGAFMCSSCGFKQEIVQDSFHFTEPLECCKDDGGCGKRKGSTTFKHMKSDALWINRQKIQLQDVPEMLQGHEQPLKKVLYVEDDLCNRVLPGDRVNVTSIIDCKQRKEGSEKSSSFDIFLKGVHIANERSLDNIEITSKEIEEFEAFSKQPDVIKRLARSIASSLYGLEEIKIAVVLSVIGAPARVKSDGTLRRGEIHLLIVGDPATGKSVILLFIVKLHPRGIYSSGKSSSGPGITAAVVKDTFGEGNYTLEAGLMVLADGGIALIDEMDKMNKDDESNLHEGMEHGTITITKVIKATLRAKTTVIGAANPKAGVFSRDQVISPQIDMLPALQSRFSMIFAIFDEPKPDRDEDIALHNLESVYDPKSAAVAPEFSSEWLMKYIQYSKRFEPVMPPEIRSALAKRYSDIRNSPKFGYNLQTEEQRTLTIRQLEDLQRLSEASSRARLSEIVEYQDVNLAVDLMEKSLKQITAGEDGTIDIVTLTTGIPKTTRDKEKIVRKVLLDLHAGEGQGAYKENVLKDVVDQSDMEEIDVLEILGRLYKANEIIYLEDKGGKTVFYIQGGK